MQVGRVVGYEVEDEFQPTLMALLQKGIEVGKAAEALIDVAKIGNVVPEVSHGRGINRRDPHCVDAQRLQIVEPCADAVQVADAVAVAVLERAWIDLIDDSVLPP